MKSLYSELAGSDDLGDLLDGDEELGNVFKALGKVGKALVKPALGIAKGIPGIGTAVSVAEGGVKAIAGAAKKKKKPAPAGKKISAKALAKKAKGMKVAKPSSGTTAGSSGAVIVAQAAPLNVARVASIFRAQISPQLASIGAQLQKHNLQAQITSEHRSRAARAAFEQKVLQGLAKR